MIPFIYIIQPGTLIELISRISLIIQLYLDEYD